MDILGISSFFHDAAAALLRDGHGMDILVLGDCVVEKAASR